MEGETTTGHFDLHHKEIVISYFSGGFSFLKYFKEIYLTVLHLPPLRFHCVDGCWDRTQDNYDFGNGK